MLSKSRDFSVFRRQNPGQKFGKMKAKSSQQITKLDDITVGSIYSIDVIYTSP